MGARIFKFLDIPINVILLIFEHPLKFKLDAFSCINVHMQGID